MPNRVVTQAIEQSESLSVQSRPKISENGFTNSFGLVPYMALGNGRAPGWWSPARDLWLEQFWKASDHLSGTMYTMASKMTAIPIKIVPKDSSDKTAQKEAQQATERLIAASGFGNSWMVEYEKWVQDLLGRDNGAFFEVIGNGSKAGPIIGQPIAVNHMDSTRCVRTGHPIYPVVYQDVDGTRYKMHFSRVMFASQMNSPRAEMYGVGFSAISRCLNVAQTLMDILIYEQEKLGSRPHRQVIITKGGLDPTDLANAFLLAEEKMDNMGLTRYSKVVVTGSQSLPEASMETHDLASMPDGFDQQTSITLGMATIALAFGTDARELFPSLTSGATRADALLQHLKQRGKGPGQILQTIETLFNFKFVSDRTRFISDFQDDAQDRQEAEIRMVRANTRVQDSSTGVRDVRTSRELMTVNQEIERSQFDRMELDDGRLPNGDPVDTMFFSDDPEINKYLDLGVDNPLNTLENDPFEMTSKIADKKAEVYEILANEKDEKVRWNATMARAALEKLEIEYLPPPPMEGFAEDQDQMSANGVDQNGQKKPNPFRQPQSKTAKNGNTYVDPRLRKVDPLTNVSSSSGDSMGDVMGESTGN